LEAGNLVVKPRKRLGVETGEDHVQLLEAGRILLDNQRRLWFEGLIYGIPEHHSQGGLDLKYSKTRRENYLLQRSLLNPTFSFALCHLNSAKLDFHRN
jgi:hypothetical protein